MLIISLAALIVTARVCFIPRFRLYSVAPLIYIGNIVLFYSVLVWQEQTTRFIDFELFNTWSRHIQMLSLFMLLGVGVYILWTQKRS
jgi:hypothetical protein